MGFSWQHSFGGLEGRKADRSGSKKEQKKMKQRQRMDSSFKKPR